MQLLPRHLKQRTLRYTVSTCIVAIVVLCRLTLAARVDETSAYLLFLAAVMSSAWIGGVGTGLYATFLSALAGNFFFMEPYFAFRLVNPHERVEFVLFLAEGTLVSVLAGQLHRARDAAIARQLETRELERRILDLSDAEQRRIGHDLHDGLGQQLTGMALIATHLERRLAAAQSPELPEAARVSQLAKEAVGWTHDLCRSLSPPALDREGLAAALRELASNSETLFGIPCTVIQADGCDVHDVSKGNHLYRIAQEAISNAAKHARPSSITVSLSFSNGQLVLGVDDNGVGLAATNSSAHGMGLRIMQYRARMIGAVVDISPRPAGGTSVKCTVTPDSGNDQTP